MLSQRKMRVGGRRDRRGVKGERRVGERRDRRGAKGERRLEKRGERETRREGAQKMCVY